MTNSQIIYVYIYLPSEHRATPAGILELTEDKRLSFGTFRYGRKYLDNPGRIPVDAKALPFPSSPEYEFRTDEGFALFGGIRDASPDGWWLAKFARHDDRYNIVRAEYASMSLAKACGLNVPEIELVKILERDVFLIKRFDRIGSAEPNQYQRIHFNSALSLLEAHESEGHKKSYEDIADVIRQLSPKPQLDARELYRRMLFNIFINNNDDHLRNHGFLHDKGRWSLSPLYDVVPTVQVGTERDLALGVGAEGRRATLKNALSRSQAFYLNPREAAKEIAKMRAAVEGWRAHFIKCGFHRSETDAFETCFLAITELVG